LERSAVVLADIRRELVKCDQEHYASLADRIADPGEKSVADLLSDIDLAEITRDVEEIREIEAALLRIAQGTYGRCIECGEAIARERLGAMPAASRCHSCQEAVERRSEHHWVL
jgi:RNA polymerase-binding transcription factor DksA